MTLVERILKVYPELTLDDFVSLKSTIEVRNDSDGKGDYIAKWEHPTFARPTDEQLKD